MTVPAAPALERLADVAALERPGRRPSACWSSSTRTRRRCPTGSSTWSSTRCRAATTSPRSTRSARATRSSCVGEAAREGYDVVVAFGGDGTVNEAANGLAGTGTPLTCLPGGSNNVFCKMLGIPNDVVDATEHLLGAARPLGAARRRPRPRQRPRLHVRGRHGPRRQRRRARRREPGHEAPLRPLVLHREGRRHVPAQVRRAAAQAVGDASTAASRSTASASSSRTASRTRTSRSGRSTSPRARGWTRATSPASCSRARTPSTCRRCSSARCRPRRCPTTAASRPSRARSEVVIRSARRAPGAVAGRRRPRRRRRRGARHGRARRAADRRLIDRSGARRRHL